MSTLKGLRIAITAIDLEQSEHRGIASVSKSIITFLAQQGAEVFLITGLTNGEESKDKKTTNQINKYHTRKLLSELNSGENLPHKNFSLKKPWPIIRFIWNYRYLIYFVIRTYSSNGVLESKLYRLKKNDIRIFTNHDRMSYIKDISGLIHIKNIFKICRLRSKRLIFVNPKLNLNKYNIDLIISMSPLSIINCKYSSAKLIQIIHDTIPIKYKKHPESAFDFYNKLHDAHLSKCIYVSKDTRKEVADLLRHKKYDNKNNNIIRPFPSIKIRDLKLSTKIKNFRNLKSNFILFNSSIVERKNLDKLIEFYLKSDLSKSKISLFVAGKLHDSEHVRKIKDLCRNKNCIHLLDYVSELEKSWLYLHSLMLVSTSSFEGFGIPVLDAITINLPVLASDIPSHRELKESCPKDRKIKLLKLNEESNWVKELNHAKQMVKTKMGVLDRINSFEIYSEIYSKKLGNKIKKIINSR